VPDSKQIRIISIADDWEGLYVDGVLVDQGHRVQLADAMRAAGVDFAEIEAWSPEYEECPPLLADVVLDA
jgi:hypothetical protein